MIAALEKLAAGSIVVLHACCHNPTGVDPTADAMGAHRRGRPRARARSVPRPRLSGLRRRHRRRRRRRARVRGHARPAARSRARSRSRFRSTASASARCPSSPRDRDETARVLSQLKRTIRANYSNPPTHGGQIVASVLCSPELRALWEAELATMRNRIKLMRALLVERLHERVARRRFPLHARAARDVLVLGAHESAGAATARGVLDLRDRHRAHLRSRAQPRTTSTTWPTRSPRSSLRRAIRRWPILTAQRNSVIIQGCPARE